jgi:nicotinate-nucleotide adenylyltransferase
MSNKGKKKVALYGGAFDPFHLGHVACIQLLLEHCKAENESLNTPEKFLDQVWVVPSGDARTDKKVRCTASLRFELCALGLLDCISPYPHPLLRLDNTELIRPVCGTMDLLDFLSSTHHDIHFYLVVGSELIDSLPTWKQSLRLQHDVEFIVIERKGSTPLSEISTDFQVSYKLKSDLPLVSSSEVRKLLFQSIPPSLHTLNTLMPSKVADYIVNFNLYRS